MDNQALSDIKAAVDAAQQRVTEAEHELAQQRAAYREALEELLAPHAAAFRELLALRSINVSVPIDDLLKTLEERLRPKEGTENEHTSTD